MTESQVPGDMEEASAAPGNAPPSASPVVGSQSRPPRRRELWPIVVVGLIIAGILISPFWAPALAPLLPWGAEHSTEPTPDYAGLAAKLEAIEQRPAAPAIDVSTIISAQGELARRVDQLEAMRSKYQQSETTIAALKSGLDRLQQQLGVIEGQAASSEDRDAAEIRKVQQDLARLTSGAADLAKRVAVLEQQPSAEDAQATDIALMLALLQIREAVEQARPFSAELGAFVALASDRPGLVAATAPLAEAAREGVVGRVDLVKRLAEVAGNIASAEATPPQADWEAQVIARLRSLVTIRRIEGGRLSQPEAAVHAAEVALGRGDLSNAVAQLDRLAGANAEAAGPWLRLAKQRLAVEAALAHLQELVVKGLNPMPGASERPPAEAPAKQERQP